ncbi:uroporphyrinogen-III C-methyltransferase [Idiomarina xiamenensis]|uniref:Uroporphyrin-III C-methyltransferase n=1 Tax=Idiomarina xiamenensis 10-D-4 TaxID=740709 RepID=K2KD14_9GAMM|nr:uroporphyrinogen-III C-methyltransferase [Idiomarina xiamenensis]EKE80599.1 uroporphyrin-III C-methyltransferase [Idiomarina xiamenensis 10-D-4]
MSESEQQQPEQTSANSRTEQSAAPQASTTKTSKATLDEATTNNMNSSNKAWYVLLLVLVAILAVGGWFGWQLWQTSQQQQQALQAQQQRLQNVLADEQAGQQSVQQQLSELRQATEQTRQQLSQALQQQQQGWQDGLAEQRLAQQAEQQRTQRQIDQLNQQLGQLDIAQTEQWRIIEANHVVQQANRQLQLNADVQQSLKLLQQADQQLAAVDSPRVNNARRALATDIATLKALEPVDINALSAQLAQLSASVTELPREQRQSSQRQTQVSDDSSDWRDNIATSWQAVLDSFIRIQRVERPTQPILSHDLRLVIEQRLQLHIEIAQLALLKQQPEVYRQALTQAEQALQLLPASQAAKRFQQRLARLSAQAIVANIPAELQSAAVLHRLSGQGGEL